MRQTIYLFLLFNGLLLSSCKKFLDKKDNPSYSGVDTPSDAQQLLDDVANVNISPLLTFGECSSDNCYLTQAAYDNNSYNQANTDTYTWGRHPFAAGGDETEDWGAAYSGVLIMNITLEELGKMKVSAAEIKNLDNVKGSALAFRSWYFWQLATAFAKSYNEETAAADMGIPLRLTANFNAPSLRSTNMETYTKIIEDLETALHLLPERPAIASRPSKRAVYGMLANVYLSMRQYDKAGLYADSSLQLNDELLDFNTLDATAKRPISQFNKEISLYMSTLGRPFSPMYDGFVDTLLYNSYVADDLRKTVFFRRNANNTISFKGSYGESYQFVGLANGEMYLVKAEAEARAGNTAKAMNDLNTLMQNRMVNTAAHPFVPFAASSPQDALQKILTERRKELVFRDRRWMDIKRLNMENANIILTRVVNGQTYTLMPNANRYAIPLPDKVIKMSGMPQNPE